MSFILDALRKAERDRSLGQAPRMEDVALAQESVGEPVGKPGIPPRALLIGALLLLIAAGLYLLLSKPAASPVSINKAPPPPAGVVTATIRGPAPTATTTPLPQTEAIASGPPALTDDGSLSTLDDLASNSDDAPQAAEAEPSEPAPAEDIRRTDFVAHPTPTNTVVEAPARTEAAPAARAEAAAAATSPAAAGATVLDDMPNDYRAQFPTLSVEVHVWDSASSKRFAMINGKTYHEGETLIAGPKLVEITQDGLVLDYRGERVLMSLLR